MVATDFFLFFISVDFSFRLAVEPSSLRSLSSEEEEFESDSEYDDVEYSLNYSEEDLLPPFPLLIDRQSLSACANGLTRSQSKRHPPNPPSRAVNDLNAA